MTKEEKKARQGQNKGRRFMSIHDGVRVCKDFIQDGECAFGDK